METENSIINSWRNPMFIIKLITLLLIAAVVTISLLRERLVNYPQWQVSVNGQGKVSYQPDIAVVLLGVQIDQVLSAEDGLRTLNQKTAKIIEAVKETGVSDNDIQTQSFTIVTHYDYINNNSKVNGYDASQELAIKIKNLDQAKNLVAEVITKATEAGANKINGINFEVSNLEELKQQARLQAIVDAKGKAQVIADAAGVKLRRVIGWWDNIIQSPCSNQSGYFDGRGGVGGGGPSSVPTGLQEIIMEVNVSYQIE